MVREKGPEMNKESPVSAAPLTEAELRAVREMLLEEERMRWLWRTTRKTAAWLAAVIGGLILVWEQLVKALRAMLGLS